MDKSDKNDSRLRHEEKETLLTELRQLTYRIATTPHDVGVADPKARIAELREQLAALDAPAAGKRGTPETGRTKEPESPDRGRPKEDLSGYGDPVPDPARTYDPSSQPYAGGRSDRSEEPDQELTRGPHDRRGRFGQHRRGRGRS
ncbi:hypothetical protein OG625_18755 [Streptomyces sp. NBC_01351]|uniref:hypothetical protein n=1 Tax=Streptomyces sp. NBC_01351 TaxID=2903833 RepID=UPI002E363A83|nr:hypothetical protein [Streptomyces sp. NBC_01351]